MNYNFDFGYLRPKKAKSLKEWYDKPFKLRKDLEVFHLFNATILPCKKLPDDNLLFGRGGVIDENGKYFDISSIERRVQGLYEFSEYDQKDEKVVYCGYMVNQWGHFLVEGVCRLWYYLRNDTTIDKYVFFIDDGEYREIGGNYKEFLQLLGVWDKVEIINKPTRYKEVIVPELSRKRTEYYSQEYKDTFETVAKNVIVNPSWQTKDKIFLTRSNLSKAKEYEFGMEMLDSFFANNGYAIIAPEKLSLSELVFYLRNAKICSSIVGSGAHNVLFAQDELKVILVEKQALNDDDQVDINRIKQFDAVNIDGISLYPVNFSGPCLYVYEGLLKKYAEDNGMIAPDEKFYNGKYIKKCFQCYISRYLKDYGYHWYMMDWYCKYADYVYEEYSYGATYFDVYLSRKKPVFFHQFFQWHYIKQLMHQLLR